MYVETHCLVCKSPDNIKIRIKQPHIYDPVEIWLVCDCGEEHYLGDEGEKPS
jgi:hypothetical protein